MKNKIFKTSIVLSLLLTMTMANFIFVGKGLISYAADNVATNHKNVEFEAYFKNQEGKQTETLEKQLNEEEETFLYLRVGVKKEGYFNGEIAIENSNFTLKEAESSYVNKIENNVITLNQINAGTTEEIKVKIEFQKNPEYKMDLLNMESSIQVKGNYRDSSQKDKEIKATRKVTLKLISGVKAEDITNNMQIITNKVLKIEGENKRVLQLSLKSGLKKNSYPIKNVQIEVTVPKIENKQPIVQENTKLTNMTNKNFVYDGNTAKLDMSNENGQWKDKGVEQIILTYIYDADINLDQTKIVANQNIELNDGTKISAIPAETVIKNSEECDGIIVAGITNANNSIYKGNLYAGIDKQYASQTNIDVNLAGVAEEIQIQENPTTYVINDTKVDANIHYTQTKTNKEELLGIIGTKGKLEILDQNGNVINIINASTEADAEGNITITYQDSEVKGIIVKLTNIEKIGTIHLNHTKVIKQTDRQIVKQATALATIQTQKYMQDANETKETSKEKKIELLETVTEAEVTMNKNSLSTLTENNVEINAILKSANEKNDLYKNPKLQIILPQEIENIQINGINKLYAEELQITKTEIKEVENVGKVLEIELAGQQTKYLNEISEGIQIVINANISFNKAMPSKKANITMKYTNENGSNPEYQTTFDFYIASKYGVLVYSKANNNNQENAVIESTSNENMKGKLEVAEGEKIVAIERNIVNNYEEPITNIGLIGTLPEKQEEEINGETLKSTFLASLENMTTNNQDAKIYYSSNNKDWEENIENVEKVKSYKIELQNKNIEPGQTATIDYQLKIPENLTANESTYEKLNVSYQYKDQIVKEDYATYLSTNSMEVAKGVQEETAKGLGNIQIKATSGGKELKDGQEVYEGQTIKQTVTITNDTGMDITNLNLIAQQENAIFYVKNVTQEIDTSTAEQMDVTRIVEDEKVKQQEFTEQILKSGESISFEYQFSVQQKAGENTLGTITIKADGTEEKNIKTITNPIKEAKVKLNITYNFNEEREIIANSTLPITLTAKNISQKELKDIIIELPIPEETVFNEEYLETSEEFTYLGIDNKTAKFKIKSIEPGEKVDIILSLEVNDFKEEKKPIDLFIKSIIDKDTYVSNEINKNATQEKAEITIDQTGSIEKKEVQTGDNLTYIATIKNASNKEQKIQIMDYVPQAAIIQKAYIVVEGQETPIEEIENNEIDIEEIELRANAEIQLIIETTIDEAQAETSEITNVVEVNAHNQYLKSNEVTYRLANITDNVTQNKIEGIVWLDENKNGKKEVQEDTFSNVVVKVMDIKTSKIVNETRTNEEGKYEFTKLPNGKYIIITEYDSKFYSLTEYKKEGVSDAENSDAIAKEINGQQVAVTDEIEINNNNVTNIDVGLIKNTIFDLRLDKYLNKVIVQSTGGTRTIEYNKEQLAKLEIDAKQVNNATVLVEYKIDITNEGEIAGYASEIVDHMPNDFKFNSELNKEWYVTNDKDLHNISLANEIIYPGETKTVTVTLVKTMTQDNVGTAINTAEIAKASNEFSIEDIDSTPGNNNSNEDDISTAELIISIRTGLGIAITVIVFIVIVALTIVMIVTMKKRRDENE